MESLDHIRDELLKLIKAAASLDALEQVRVGALGRNGRLTGLLKGLGALKPEERKRRGADLNTLKGEVEAALAAAQQKLAGAALETRLAGEKLDGSLPGKASGERPRP